MVFISLRTASVVAGLVGTAAYLNSVYCGFCFDDASAVENNLDLRPETPWTNLFMNDFWGTPMNKEGSHKSYRPLTVATFRLNYLIGGLNPAGYHFANAVLHGFVCGLFVITCDVVFKNTWTSIISGLLFALHPIHTEAVAGVVGRAESLSAIFFLLAFLSYTKCVDKSHNTGMFQLLCSLVFTGLSMLCKEQGITVVGICVVYDVFVVHKVTISTLIQHFEKKSMPSFPRPALGRFFALLVGVVALMALRLRLMHGLPVFMTFDNPAAFADFPVKQLTFAYLVAVNLWLLCTPAGLLCDWSMGTIPLVTAFDPRNLLSLVTFLTLFVFGVYAISASTRRNHGLVVALSIMVLSFLPASNLFFPVGFVVAERILYVPSMGFCMLVALGLETLSAHNQRRLQHILRCSLVLLLTLFATKTVIRNSQWESDETLFKAALKITGNNAKVFSNLGHFYEDRSQPETAEHYFLQSVQVQPDDTGAWINVGRISKVLEKRDAAEKAYRRAISLMPAMTVGESIRVAPSHINVFFNLANLLKNSSDPGAFAEAEKLYLRAISLRKDYVEAYNNYADLLIKLKRSEEAEQMYEKAVQIDPTYSDAHFNLGVMRMGRKDVNGALQAYRTAVKSNPQHQMALNNLGLLLEETGHKEEAKEVFERLTEVNKTDHGGYFGLALIAMDENNWTGAIKWFKKTLEVLPHYRSALFNLALAYNHVQKFPETLAAIEELLKYHPEHKKGLILRGDTYLSLRQPTSAIEAYKLALQIDPNYTTALHNLAVAYSQLNQHGQAEILLQKVIQIDASYPDAVKNLKIIQTKLHQDRVQSETHKKSG